MWYSLKFSTAMNRLQTGWVILMAASTTKRGPLRFSLVFFSQTWVYIQLHPTRGGNCGNLCSQLFTAQLQGFLWTQVGQMLVASWCRKCSQGSKMKQFLSMSFCSVVWGPGEHSNIQIYIYLVRSHLEMWQQCWVASLEAKARWVVSCNHPISCILQCRSGTELAMKPRKIMIMISRSILPAQVPG